MKDLIHDQLRALAQSLTLLHGRVRSAVAGEVSKAVADAVGETVAALLGGAVPQLQRWTGHPRPAGAFTSRHDDWYEQDEWDDPDTEDDTPAQASTPGRGLAERIFEPRTAAALTLALAVGRWWRLRHGGAWPALGLGLSAALAALGGGPLVQAALKAYWAAQRLLLSADVLGEGARAAGRL